MEQPIKVLAVGLSDEQIDKLKSVNQVPHPKFEFIFRESRTKLVKLNVQINRSDLIIVNINNVYQSLLITPVFVKAVYKNKQILLVRNENPIDDFLQDDAIEMLKNIKSEPAIKINTVIEYLKEI